MLYKPNGGYTNAYEMLMFERDVCAEYAQSCYNFAMCAMHEVDKQKYMQLVNKYTDLGRKLQNEMEILTKAYKGE